MKVERVQAEVLINVQLVVVTADIAIETSADELFLVGKLSVRVVGNVLQLKSEQQPNEMISILELGHHVSVITSKSTIKYQKDTGSLTIRLQLADFDVLPQENDASLRPITRDLLRNLSHLECGQCFSDISVRGREFNIQDMPSDYWHELLECWVCHPNEDLKRVSNLDLSSQPGRLLLGSSLLLLDEQDLEVGAFRKTEPTRSEWNNELLCVKCGHMLGVSKENAPRRPNGETRTAYQLFKSSLVFKISDGSSKTTTLMRCFMFDVHENHRAHGFTRFIVPSGRNALLLWVLQWDARVHLGQMFESAVKILYQYVNIGDTVYQTWHSSPDVETLDQPLYTTPANFLQILHQLMRVNSMLPSQQRFIRGFNQTFVTPKNQ